MELFNPGQKKRSTKLLFIAAVLGPLIGVLSALFGLSSLSLFYNFIITNGDISEHLANMLNNFPIAYESLIVLAIPLTITLGIPTVLLLKDNDLNKPWQYFILGGFSGCLLSIFMPEAVLGATALPFSSSAKLYASVVIWGSSTYFSALIYFKP